eukprot:CAMPEP_0177760912 /NCGR_PEP_ID=MMETSP0491_2-20121128/5523_1 /TAXON_ID=63592 /ORGANISM="Tetraselmis chuii, Strain PLY429" /LENGTH=139 /DNA_ID=CAMNT_0019276849 /DNA_START=313 /DNA_END=728 /DNA_ORIENTATION=+
MVKKGKSRTSRNVGSTKCKKTHKQNLRAQFEARHIDQVWQDVRKADGVTDGKVGPVGTTDRVELDEDLPAHGQHYCISCSRYFVSNDALVKHCGTKSHKKRVKVLLGDKPHSKLDAELAGNMGAPDNGPKLRSSTAVVG